MSSRPVVIIRTRDERGKTPARPPDSSGPLAGAPGLAHRRPHTFLVVDDSAVHLNLLARQLQSGLGCHVAQADGVETAIGYLLTAHPDVMMVDLMMPELDGVDLISVLDLREEWRSIPIVINSAVSDHDRVRSLKGARVREYLLKPFNPQLALPRLDRILRSLPPAKPTGPVSPTPPVGPDNIPVVLAGVGLAEEARTALPPSCELVVVPSGPAALVAAVELRPWIVFVGADVVGWPQTKTVRSLMALKEAGRVRTIPLPKTADAADALELFRREFGQSPFEVQESQGETSVHVSETFTPGCIRALKREIDAALARGAGRIIFDIPYHSIQRGALAVLQELVHSLRKDG